MNNIDKLGNIVNDLNKEISSLYKIIEEKDKLIKLQRQYIWQLIKEKYENKK